MPDPVKQVALRNRELGFRSGWLANVHVRDDVTCSISKTTLRSESSPHVVAATTSECQPWTSCPCHIEHRLR